MAHAYDDRSWLLRSTGNVILSGMLLISEMSHVSEVGTLLEQAAKPLPWQSF